MKLAAPYAEIMAHGRLPSPGATALEVLRLTRDPEVHVAALGRVIASDPAICARIIRAVNAPTVGLRRPVASIEQAVMVLGFRAVAGITIAFSLLDRNRSGLPEFDYDSFWLAAVAQAVAARVLVGKTRVWPGDEAFTYGLLSNIGRLALVSVYPQRYRDVLLTLGGTSSGELATAERAVFDVDSETLSAFLMREWGMPAYHEAISGGEHGGSARSLALLHTCRVGASLARVLVEPEVSRDQMSELVRSLAAIGIDAEVMVWLFKDVVERYREAAAILQMPARQIPSLAEIYAHAVERT